MENFKKTYRDLEMRVMRELRTLVENSPYTSKHVDEKAIKLNGNAVGFTELTVINDALTFLDVHGLQYYLYADATLEDLIEMLNCGIVTDYEE